MFDFVRKPLLWSAWDAGLADEIGSTPDFELKAIQDLAVYTHLRDAAGLRIAEAGAGNSRLLPALAPANECVAVDKFAGEAGGPSRAPEIAGVRTVAAYLGEGDPGLADAAFDVVFSISVLEHVGGAAVDAFHRDQLRILKPRGLFLHAIDIYLEDSPAPLEVGRFETYRRWVTSTPSVEPIGPVYEGPCRFSCDLATNPDNVMYLWGRSAPALTELRQSAQSASVLVGGRKLAPSGDEGNGPAR